MDTPLGRTIEIDEVEYVVVKLGTPVCSESATTSFLKNLDFSANDLTCVVSGTDTVGYVAWCTQAVTQKLVTPALMKVLLDAAGDLGNAQGKHTVSLADGRSFEVPNVPTVTKLSHTKKRKAESDIKAACEVLESGTFVIDDALMQGGKLHPDVKRVTFAEDKPLAETLMALQETPPVDELHTLARRALGSM